MLFRQLLKSADIIQKGYDYFAADKTTKNVRFIVPVTAESCFFYFNSTSISSLFSPMLLIYKATWVAITNVPRDDCCLFFSTMGLVWYLKEILA
jgi:hypothetical protein